MTTPDDDELETYLNGDHPVSRAYRDGAREQAPSELDGPILRAAREEARPAGRRWYQPMAAAASVALTLGLVVAVHDRLPWPATARDEAVASGHETRSSSPKDNQTDTAADKSATDSSQQYAAEPSSQDGAASSSGVSRDEAAETLAVEDRDSASETDGAGRKSNGNNEQPSVRKLEERMEELADRQESLTSQNADQDGELRADQRQELKQELEKARQELETLQQRRASADTAEGERKDGASAVASDGADSSEKGNRAEGAQAAARASASDSSGDTDDSQAAASAEDNSVYRRSPEAWLEHIRELSEQGKDEEVTDEVAAFQRQYPDRELPRDLEDRVHDD